MKYYPLSEYLKDKFGEKVYVFNGFEIPSELGKPQFKDKEISIILSSLFNYNKNEVYKRSLIK